MSVGKLAGQLFQENYHELVVIARARRRRSNRNQTLGTIDILHESFIRFNKSKTWENRDHFINAAALAIRNVIIDYARRKNASKRSHGVRTTSDSDDTGLMPEFWETSERLVVARMCLDLSSKI